MHGRKAGLPCLRNLWTQLAPLLPRGGGVRFRMDGAFFRQDVLRCIDMPGAGYAIQVPFYRWLDLQQDIRTATPWMPGAPEITTLLAAAATTLWGRTVRVAIYRKKVRHHGTKS